MNSYLNLKLKICLALISPRGVMGSEDFIYCRGLIPRGIRFSNLKFQTFGKFLTKI